MEIYNNANYAPLGLKVYCYRDGTIRSLTVSISKRDALLLAVPPESYAKFMTEIVENVKLLLDYNRYDYFEKNLHFRIDTDQLPELPPKAKSKRARR